MHSTTRSTASPRAPRRRRAALPLAGAALVVAVTGCSDGDGEAGGPDETDATTATATATSPAESPTEGAFWCQSVNPEEIEKAVPGGLADAMETVVQDDADGYECEVQISADGQEPVDALRFRIAIDAQDEFAEARTDYVDDAAELQAGVTAGPPWLGESYLADTSAVAMAPCGAPRTAEVGTEQVPYMLQLEAPLEGTELTKPDFVNILTRTMRSLDQTQGCSPSEAAPTGPTG